jgi:hypothetical protein
MRRDRFWERRGKVVPLLDIVFLCVHGMGPIQYLLYQIVFRLLRNYLSIGLMEGNGTGCTLPMEVLSFRLVFTQYWIDILIFLYSRLHLMLA